MTEGTRDLPPPPPLKRRGKTIRPAVTRRDQAPKEKPKKSVPYRQGVVTKGMTKFYGMVAMMVMMIDPDAGSIIAGNAEAMAESWEVLARTNPTVRLWLYRMIATSGWGAVLAAHVPMMIAMARRFGGEKMKGAMDLVVASTNGDILKSPSLDSDMVELGALLKDIDSNPSDEVPA